MIDYHNTVVFGDCRESMRQMIADGVQVQCCVTSPPYYGLRRYTENNPDEIGTEQTPEAYVANLVEVFRLVRELLADDGVCWLNLGDSYGKNKQLLGIPWRVAFALQDDGWILRQDICWHKSNAMPESVTDRCTKAHEYIFLLTKSPRYYFDHVAIKEPLAAGSDVAYRNKLRKGKAYNAKAPYQKNFPASFDEEKRNRRSVWTVATKPYTGAHFAVFPESLITPCILAGSKPANIVFDPFMGSGTTAATALKHGRNYLGCELNPDYADMQADRTTCQVEIFTALAQQEISP